MLFRCSRERKEEEEEEEEGKKDASNTQ